MVRALVKNRVLKILICLAMIFTSGYELVIDFEELGAHHGIFMFALVELLKTISELYEAAEIVSDE